MSSYPPEKSAREEEHPPPQPPRPKAVNDSSYSQPQYPQIPVSQSGKEHQYPPVPVPGPPGFPSTMNVPPPQYNTHGTEPQYEFPPPPMGGPPGGQFGGQQQEAIGGQGNQQYAQQQQPAVGGQANQQYGQHQQPLTGNPVNQQHLYQQQPPVGNSPIQQYTQQHQPAVWTPQYDGPPVMTPGNGQATDTISHGKLSTWDKTRNTSKAGFDKLWNGFEKLGVPVNKLTNKIGSEAFWPQSLDKESDKCARILKSFCKDGFYSEAPTTNSTAPKDGPKGKPKVLVKIPPKVIKNAVALAIFTTMRTGLWVSGAGGSGVLISRLPDGSWSPPSGLLIHTAGVGFMAGIDIYDCVLVINTPSALAAFKKVRLSLGGEISLAAGPIGIGGVGEYDLGDQKSRKPVWTYMKSRGLYAGVQIDGSIVIERNDENARFYGERVPAADILAGKLRSVPQSTRLLMEVLKEAEGQKNVDQHILNEVHGVPPPGDMLLEKGAEPTNDQKQQYGGDGYVRYA